MSANREPPGRHDADEAIAQLRGLLDLAQLVRSEPGRMQVLTAVAGTVSRALGFATVVVNLYRPQSDDYEVSTVHGSDQTRAAVLGRVTTAASWSAILQPGFQGHGVFFLPDDEANSEQSATGSPGLAASAADDESAWRSGDGLFVTLDGSAGRHYGIMSVAEPESGRRPDEQQLEVLSAVAGHVALAIDHSERRQGEEHLVHMAYHDALTGLPNRVLVEQELDLALARARRRRAAVALMFIDLDDFKEANDRLGHAAGDRLLSAVSTRLRFVLRDSDLLARQGGDEFIVVIADIAEDPRAAAEAVAGKLLDVLREPFVVSGAELRVSASIGISIFPDDAADTETLLRHADTAMYRAKSAGGGQLAFHRASGEIQSRRLSLATQLRRAISRSELELHYQPIWRLDAPRTIVGVEALLRWRHPDRGLLAPKAFITMAEQSAAGDDVTDWILGAACRQSQEWGTRGLAPRLSVNVSPQQLLAPGFATRFADHISACEIPGDRLMVELTESAWTVDAAETMEVISEVRQTGVQLAIDDFGAGYSSLARLRELDFDVIKVDRGLLAGIPADGAAVAIFRAIVDLAQAYGAAIIAQGVESAEQLDHLTAHGIRQAQGFLLGRPTLGAELTSMLTEHRTTS